MPIPVRDAIRQYDHRVHEVVLAIGPERGWTEDEAQLFQRDHDFKMCTLGTSILRVDTAVVSALALATAALDELDEGC